MKKAILWILAILLTLASAYYQRTTGPTYPKKIKLLIDNKICNIKLPRSGNSLKDKKIVIPVKDGFTDTVKLHYRRYPVNEPFTSVNFSTSEKGLIAVLPKQAPAGKLEYYLTIHDSNNRGSIKTEHLLIRFKGEVPAWALIPHVIFMFMAMLLSNLAGLFAIGKEEKHVRYGKLTLLFLILGGFIFGPIVQHYAFGQAWTGIPFGWDLTDNKTLFAIIFWIIAVIGNKRSPKYRYTIIASIVLLLIYIIPHSLFGSELDYSSGEVVTGIILYMF